MIKMSKNDIKVYNLQSFDDPFPDMVERFPIIYGAKEDTYFVWDLAMDELLAKTDNLNEAESIVYTCLVHTFGKKLKKMGVFQFINRNLWANAIRNGDFNYHNYNNLQLLGDD